MRISREEGKRLHNIKHKPTKGQKKRSAIADQIKEYIRANKNPGIEGLRKLADGYGVDLMDIANVAIDMNNVDISLSDLLMNIDDSQYTPTMSVARAYDIEESQVAFAALEIGACGLVKRISGDARGRAVVIPT